MQQKSLKRDCHGTENRKGKAWKIGHIAKSSSSSSHSTVRTSASNGSQRQAVPIKHSISRLVRAILPARCVRVIGRNAAAPLPSLCPTWPWGEPLSCDVPLLEWTMPRAWRWGGFTHRRQGAALETLQSWNVELCENLPPQEPLSLPLPLSFWHTHTHLSLSAKWAIYYWWIVEFDFGVCRLMFVYWVEVTWQHDR